MNTNKLDIGKLQDIPKALLRLVKNATWMCITFGGTMDGFILAGNEIVMIYKDKSCLVVHTSENRGLRSRKMSRHVT